MDDRSNTELQSRTSTFCSKGKLVPLSLIPLKWRIYHAFIVLKWCHYRVWYIKWCLRSSCFIGASRSKARCTKWPTTIIESRCRDMCRALTILGFKSCWLFNNHDLSPANLKLKRNFGIRASLEYLSISVNAIWYFMFFGKKIRRAKWRLNTTFGSQQVYFFISKIRAEIMYPL